MEFILVPPFLCCVSQIRTVPHNNLRHEPVQCSYRAPGKCVGLSRVQRQSSPSGGLEFAGRGHREGRSGPLEIRCVPWGPSDSCNVTWDCSYRGGRAKTCLFLLPFLTMKLPILPLTLTRPTPFDPLRAKTRVDDAN